MKLLDERFLQPSPATVIWMQAKEKCRECRHVYVHREYTTNEVIRCRLANVDEDTQEVIRERKPRSLPSYAMDVWEAVCKGEKFDPAKPKPARAVERWKLEHT